MIASQGWLSLTRATGLAAYAAALTCCAIAWIKTKANPRISRLAAVLMVIEGALLLDIAFNWRWQIHQAMMDYAQRRHEYEERHGPQQIVLLILMGVFLFGLFRLWRTFRNRGTTLLAVSGALLSLIVWCVEVVSLHAIDHVLYSSLGGVMSVSLLWILSCTMTSLGILLDPR